MEKIHSDICIASTLSGDFYSSEEMFKKTVDNIFSRTWQFICDDSLLASKNDVYPFTFLDPIRLTKDDEWEPAAIPLVFFLNIFSLQTSGFSSIYWQLRASRNLSHTR